MTERRAHDYYVTPNWVVHRLLDVLDLDEHSCLTICDPCAGDQELRKAFFTWEEAESLPVMTWHMNDIRPEADSPGNFDYLAKGVEFDRVHITIMNPPFIDAMRFVKKAMTHSREVYALLRLSWMASAKRRDFLAQYPPDLFVIPNRPSYDGVGSAGEDYAWYRFPGRRQPPVVLDVTPLNIRKAEMARTRRVLEEKAQ